MLKFGTVVKLLLGMPEAHIGVLVLSPGSFVSEPLPAYLYCRRLQMMA